jgi:hypothetical protein
MRRHQREEEKMAFSLSLSLQLIRMLGPATAFQVWLYHALFTRVFPQQFPYSRNIASLFSKVIFSNELYRCDNMAKP